MADIVLDNVSKAYDDEVPAVDGLSLEIPDGELLVLVGPSGCGKSTVLRMVAGLEAVSAGAIRIGGQMVNDVPPQRRGVAMVFQNYALYPHMTVRSNLEFPLRMQKLPRLEIDRRVAQTAQMLDLTELLERRPKALSGGQRQRVAMGRAIVRDADAFLMDEPLSNLDAKLRGQIRTEIAALQARLGVTTIYVTHDQAEAMTLGQRVAVIRAGRLQQVAPPHELYERPANVFVAGFIGSPGMNVLSATLVHENGGFALRLGERRIRLPEAVCKRQPTLVQWTGRELLAGIRPEALQPAAAEATDTLAATLRASESLGHETILHCNAEVASELTAALPGHHALAAGAVLHLHVDTENLRLFAPDGMALS